MKTKPNPNRPSLHKFLFFGLKETMVPFSSLPNVYLLTLVIVCLFTTELFIFKKLF